MVGLTNEEKKELENMEMRKVEFKYKLVLTEKMMKCQDNKQLKQKFNTCAINTCVECTCVS